MHSRNIYRYYLDGDGELLEHLAGRLLNLQSDLRGTVHEIGDITELWLLHAASGEGWGANANASGGNSRPVPLLSE